MRILLVEDDTGLSATLSRNLRKHAAVDIAATGRAAFSLANSHTYDCFILDINLPDTSGIDLCSQLRSNNILTPCIFLTGESDITTILRAFSEGGDDYLTKPFQFSELLARIQAITRRNARPPQPPALHLGDISLDLNRHSAKVNQIDLNLRRKELEILEIFLSKPGVLISRASIIDQLWDEENDPYSNTVDVHIHRLRKELEKHLGYDPIQTVRGSGYIFNITPYANHSSELSRR